MTLDEGIKYEEEVAEAEEQKARVLNGDFYKSRRNECLECAEEHRQLAEWLRELKKLREIPDKLVPKYRDGIPDEYDRGANEMLEEVIDDIRKYMEEVNADADSN